MSSAIIERFLITEKDKKALSQIVFDSKDTSDDFFDYSKVVVKKPWGYEYLIFENKSVVRLSINRTIPTRWSTRCRDFSHRNMITKSLIT